MHTCNDVLALIVSDVEEALSSNRRDDLRHHLAACEGCREIHRAQLEVRDILRSRPPVAVSPGFDMRLAARLDAISSAWEWLTVADWRVWTYRLAPVAAVLALFTVAVDRQPTPAAPPELAVAVDTWAFGGQTGMVPVAAIFGQPEISDEELLATVLTAQTDMVLDGVQYER